MKLKGPLFSVGAHGVIQKTLIYSRRSGINVLRKFHKPTGLASSAQTIQRTTFKAIINVWNTRTDAEKQGWADLAPHILPLSGYNIFLRSTAAKRAVRIFGNAKFAEVVFGAPSL